MATKSKFGSIDDYIAGLPPEAQAFVSQLRALVHDTVSGVTERISYDMPSTSRVSR